MKKELAKTIIENIISMLGYLALYLFFALGVEVNSLILLLIIVSYISILPSASKESAPKKITLLANFLRGATFMAFMALYIYASQVSGPGLFGSLPKSMTLHEGIRNIGGYFFIIVLLSSLILIGTTWLKSKK